jgi:hypothetical protein
MPQQAQKRLDESVAQKRPWHDNSGRFAKNNPGGTGGAKPGGGRPSKPENPSLLRQLYVLLDEASPMAMELLISHLNHEDPRIAQGAARLTPDKVSGISNDAQSVPVRLFTHALMVCEWSRLLRRFRHRSCLGYYTPSVGCEEARPLETSARWTVPNPRTQNGSHGKVMCLHFTACPDVAVRKRWASFSCECCKDFGARRWPWWRQSNRPAHVRP